MKKDLFLFLGIFVLVCSCQKNSCSNATKAKFHEAADIGCGMIIELNNGKFIEPKNLDDFAIQPKHGE